MATKKWHILIAAIILLIGITVLSLAERQINPNVSMTWIALRDIGLAFLVGAVPYALFEWVASDSPKNDVQYLGSKREIGSRLDGQISRAKKRIDVVGLSLNDLFSGSVTPSLLVDKLRQGCHIRLFALDPTSSVLDLRAADEGIEPEELRQSILNKVDKRWRELSRLLEKEAAEHQHIPGRLDLLFYESLPYFTLFRTDDVMTFGLYNRNAACNTSVAFDVSTNEELFRKFEEDIDYLAGSQLIKRKAIHFRGGSGAVYKSIY